MPLAEFGQSKSRAPGATFGEKTAGLAGKLGFLAHAGRESTHLVCQYEPAQFLLKWAKDALRLPGGGVTFSSFFRSDFFPVIFRHPRFARG